jgi:general secretion pathway protein E
MDSGGAEGAVRYDRPAFERALTARLIDSGKLDAAAADRALRLRADNNERLEEILTKLGLVQEPDVAVATAEELGLALATPDDLATAVAIAGASPKFLRQALILALDAQADRLVLAVANPLNEFAIRSLSLLAAKPVEIRVATPSDIALAHDRLYHAEADALDQIVDRIDDTAEGHASEDVARLRNLASEEPIIRLVNLLIGRAVESRASDIHIEPFANRLSVRFRVDGVLLEAAAPPPRHRAAIVSRIKIMAKLNIAERRLPQDGRIRIAIRGRDYDLRVATLPTLHGEGVTMRILDRSNLVDDFRELGFEPDTLQRYLELLHRPHGVLLVTGPTGSGKTTTLYASLRRLNTIEKKIFTVEDPIEYQIDGINQVQVRAQINLAFADILRALLRHNPDIIMIGEMRDSETAKIAIQAALTGHLVLSTLHTNNAASSITRLLDMGVEDYIATSTLNGVLAQRLVRRLCKSCRRRQRVLPELVERMELASLPGGREPELYEPVGCRLCHSTGYHGQLAVIEVLQVSEAISRLILRHATATELHQAAVGEGMRTMYQDGLLKALSGETTMEEVLRVTRDV